MSKPIYHATNYRKNLLTYWQQFYPNWTIPSGYHVHHIKPKCLFDKDDSSAHHPRNLIALHPDDHMSIHRCRGDKWVNESFLKILGTKSIGMKGKRHSEGSKAAISAAQKGKKINPEQAAKRKGTGNPFYGRKHTSESLLKMSNSSKGQGKGRIVSNETKEKISKTKTGVRRKPFSEEHKAKIAASMRGNNNASAAEVVD